MTLDSVFWIASMIKALTATAAMQLVEQGKLQLDEPISKVPTTGNRNCVRPSGQSRCATC